jgi:hypothetical protein
LQDKKCKKFNFFQNQNDTCAHPFTLVMKFHDRQSSERCIRKLISRHCLDKTQTSSKIFLICLHSLKAKSFVHVWGRKSRSSVIKNRKSFHLVRVLSRQWRLINFRMHRYTCTWMTCHTQMIFQKRLIDGWQNVSAATYVVCQHTYRLNFLCGHRFVPKCTYDFKESFMYMYSVFMSLTISGFTLYTRTGTR